jgi:precorrin-6A/cobalt-precorrin-6A reductase
MLVRPVLILGGTAEARELAGLLIARGFAPVTSLAGATSDPLLPPGGIRRGGFGSVQGMVRYATGAFMVAIADASHPFAVQISAHAAAAAQRMGIPYVRLERPEWTARADDQWIPVDSIAAAAAAIPAGARVLVTTGRKELGPFLARSDIGGVIRTVEAPRQPLPDNWALLRQRPPFSMAEECDLMEREAITLLVSKNAGGEATRAKLDAAREKKIPVIMVQRPRLPEAPVFWPAAALADHLALAISA